MPTTQLPKQEEIMASNNGLSGFVRGNDTEIALCLFLPHPLLFSSNFSYELAALARLPGQRSHPSAQGSCKLYQGTALTVMTTWIHTHKMISFLNQKQLIGLEVNRSGLITDKIEIFRDLWTMMSSRNSGLITVSLN